MTILTPICVFKSDHYSLRYNSFTTVLCTSVIIRGRCGSLFPIEIAAAIPIEIAVAILIGIAAAITPQTSLSSPH